MNSIDALLKQMETTFDWTPFSIAKTRQYQPLPPTPSPCGTSTDERRLPPTERAGGAGPGGEDLGSTGGLEPAMLGGWLRSEHGGRPFLQAFLWRGDRVPSPKRGPICSDDGGWC